MRAIIFDTEYTTWSTAHDARWGESHQFRELVQIAAVKLDISTQTWEQAATFEAFTRPVVYPQLSECFTGLTGITQAEMEEKARPLAEVLTGFNEFCEDLPVFSNGQDSDILLLSAATQNVPFPMERKRFFSLRPLLYDALEREKDPAITAPARGHCSGEVYKLLKLKLPTDAAHNALFDCHSLVATLQELAARGHDVLTPCLRPAHGEQPLSAVRPHKSAAS